MKTLIKAISAISFLGALSAQAQSVGSTYISTAALPSDAVYGDQDYVGVNAPEVGLVLDLEASDKPEFDYKVVISVVDIEYADRDYALTSSVGYNQYYLKSHFYDNGSVGSYTLFDCNEYGDCDRPIGVSPVAVSRTQGTNKITILDAQDLFGYDASGLPFGSAKYITLDKSVEQISFIKVD